MTLESSARHLYEPILGIVLFAMRDQSKVVHCMVSECALRHRAIADRADEEAVETLFPLP